MMTEQERKRALARAEKVSSNSHRDRREKSTK